MKLLVYYLSGLILTLFTVSADATGRHYVFAHYMVCYATYGQNIKGYEREIKEAQAAGIDGFVLDIGEWNHPVYRYYNQHVALMYQAAEQLGTNFKFIPFVEFWSPTNIINLVEAYGNRPNTFRYQGKIVLSSWGMGPVPTRKQPGLDWADKVLDPLQRAGYSVFFIPHFWAPYYRELPGYSDAESVLNQSKTFLSGLFLVACAGLPGQLALCNSNYTKAVHDQGKIFMASYCPHYWGSIQYSNGRRYYESNGGEGTILQWKSIIASQPDWVDMFTWNDFNESTYSSPVENPEHYESQLQKPIRYCHAGYLELSKYYIQWYKTGQEPPIEQDALFYFYRTHPKDAMASGPKDRFVSSFSGDVQDVIYATVFLTGPAQLEIASGDNLTTNLLSAGISSIRVPFAPGVQRFVLRRDGREVLAAQGPDILSKIKNYDFFPASGYAYGLARQ